MNERTKKVERLVSAIQKKPQLSTCLAAAMLAGFWIVIWLFVFFVSLIFLGDTKTSLYALFVGMWLSTCVESLIRWFENTPLARQFAKPYGPHTLSESEDYPPLKATLIFVVGLLVTVMVAFSIRQSWMDFPQLTFDGIPTDVNPLDSGREWLNLLTHNATISVILACFLLRIAIYKRRGKNPH